MGVDVGPSLDKMCTNFFMKYVTHVSRASASASRLQERVGDREEGRKPGRSGRWLECCLSEPQDMLHPGTDSFVCLLRA